MDNKILKEERASITILSVVIMIFIIILLVLAFISISNKKSSQIKKIEQIESSYDSDIERTYKQTVEKDGIKED